MYTMYAVVWMVCCGWSDADTALVWCDTPLPNACQSHVRLDNSPNHSLVISAISSSEFDRRNVTTRFGTQWATSQSITQSSPQYTDARNVTD